MGRAWVYSTACILFLSSLAVAAGKSAPSIPLAIPPAPKYYVLDESARLTPIQSQALSAVLIEHDQATGERIYVGIFNTLDKINSETRTAEIFEQWQGGHNENGILLAVFVAEKKAALHYGVGFDGRLNGAKADKITRDLLIPELKQGRLYRALGMSMLELLRSIDSPLIDSDRAEELLQSGGMNGAITDVRGETANGTWWIWILLGAIPMLMVTHNILASEAHFTSSGWFRANPLKLIDWKHLRASAQAKRVASTHTLGGADGSW